MSEFNKESLPNLELKIENMLDKLIETDEELEKKGDYSTSKINEEISNYEDEKYFEKDFFINRTFQKEDENKANESNNKALQVSSQNKIIRVQNNISELNNKNILYSNFPPQACLYNQIYGRLSNSNMNSNCTTSFSSNYDNNNLLGTNLNSNTSYLFTYNNINFKDNNSLMNYGYQDFNNSFYAGDKNCFNKNNNSYMFYNNNVEIEILLIEVKKILNKFEKIDLTIYNKLKGKFEQIVRTHKGSRIFQNYLKSTHTDILHQIFLELKNKLPELLKDNYANYFCKKFFTSLSQKDRIEFLTMIQNDLSSLAIDFIATYPVQGIIEQLGSKAEKKIIYLGIKDSINAYCYNVYGTHILEKILSYFEEEFVKEIIDYVYKNFIDLSFHINGICIVKKLLLMTHKKSLHNDIKKIIYDNAMNLIVHQYGNYVIQTIVENWDNNELEDILNLYKNKYIYLSKQKYSSNAVERILEKNKKYLENYINEVCNDNNNIIEIIKNKFGNYVIQKAVRLSNGLLRERIIGEISKNINKLEDKKLISKWKAIISSKYYL
jgi:hypothetical protein